MYCNMAKLGNKVKITVFLGYLSLSVIAFVTVWLIYNETLRISDDNFDPNPVNQKFHFVNSILTNLYEAESFEGNYLRTGERSQYKSYSRLMDSIGHQVDSMSVLFSNPSQKLHTDSIKLLLDKKRQNLKDLVALKRKGSSEQLYQRAMQKLTSNQDSIAHYFSIYKTVTTQKDSIYVKQKKKKFFNRLVNAFSANEEVDSSLQVVINQSVQIDSVINSFNPTDSITTFLLTIIEEIHKESKAVEKQLFRKGQEVFANDQTITAQIRAILSKLRDEELAYSVLKVSRQQTRIGKMTQIIIVLGILALIIIVGFLFLIMKDITRSQLYRLRLEKEKSYSETLLKGKQQLILSITHDLKSPLSSIIGFSQLMKKKDGATQQHRQYLHYIVQSADYILRLINDLLNFSQLENGKLKTENVRFNLRALVNEVVSGFFPQAKSKGLVLELKINDLPDFNHLGDPIRIKQVMANLISNAIKFTDQGVVTVAVKVIGTKNNTDKIRIEIIDTGIGIRKENMQLVFEEFSKATSAGDKQYDGSGLGLAISRRIVHLLNGSINLSSRFGEGSNFTIEIPLKRLTEHGLDTKSTKKLQSDNKHGFLFNEEKILLVDDDQVLLEMTTQVLRAANLQVVPYSNSEEAVGAIDQQSFDLLITDIQMPGMDGIELMSYFKSHTKKTVPTIAISGRIEKNNEYVTAGFSAFLQKPYKPEELLYAVDQTLKNRKVNAFQNTIDETESEQTTPTHYSIKNISAFAQGDDEGIRQILVSFVKDAELNLALLKNYTQQSAYDMIVELAHKMLPMFLQIEAHAIARLLAGLEQNSVEHLETKTWDKTCQQAIKYIEELLEVIRKDHHIVS